MKTNCPFHIFQIVTVKLRNCEHQKYFGNILVLQENSQTKL